MAPSLTHLPNQTLWQISNCLNAKDKAHLKATCKGIQGGLKTASLIAESSKKLEEKRNEYEALKKHRDALMQSIYEKHCDLNRSCKSWFGWFISKLNHEKGLRGLINRLFQRLFPAFKKQVIYQKQLQTNLKVLHNQLIGQTKNPDSLEHEIYMLSKQKRELEADELIMNLFGGAEQFEKIPVLDIGNRQGETGYIDFIHPQEMAYPIMRGVDKYKRPFFIIKGTSNGKFMCQTFFQRYPDDKSNWSQAGNNLLEIRSYLITNGAVKEVNKLAYHALKELLQKGTAEEIRFPLLRNLKFTHNKLVLSK